MMSLPDDVIPVDPNSAPVEEQEYEKPLSEEQMALDESKFALSKEVKDVLRFSGTFADLSDAIVEGVVGYFGERNADFKVEQLADSLHDWADAEHRRKIRNG